VQDVMHASNEFAAKPYSQSSVSQYLKRLSERGLVYKNRLGRYQFAVPMMSDFISRQAAQDISRSVPFASSTDRRRPS
jgi:DNA-binding transcriptional ArsR family regulator